MTYKHHKNFYKISFLSFTIFCIGIFYLNEDSKIYTFISTLSGGVFAACILYFVVEIIPATKKKKNSLEVLNRTICSVLETYFRPNMFQHEKSIKHISLEYISSIEKIKKAQEDIKNFKINFLQLKYPIETAHSRYNDFQNLLILVNNISPNHSLLWLDIIEKIRLMAEEYNQFTDNYDLKLLSDLRKLKNFNDRHNKTYLMCTSLQIRILEFFESVEKWIDENN